MKISKTGSSMKQVAYARRSWGAAQETKKLIALDVGYSPNVANSVASKIETRKGYLNAMTKLAAESNNIALSVMFELKARGFENFSNKDLVAALNAIGGAWERFNKPLIDRDSTDKEKRGNKLRTVILQNVQTQNITAAPPEDLLEPQPEDVPTDLDF